MSLDDAVHLYVPSLPDFGVPITLRHLMRHTSGLRDHWELLSLAGWRYSKDLITDDDILAVVSRQQDLNFQPGDEYLYCNTGYALVAQVLKTVSGQSLRVFTSARIFEPLGMSNTFFRDNYAEVIRNVAEGYVDTERGVEISDTNLDTVGATSLLTTVEDLALWDEDFYHHRVGGPAIIARMVDRGRLNDGSDIDYASRLGLGTHRGLAIVEQPAATPASAPISSAFPSSISRWRSLPISGRSCRATSHGGSPISIWHICCSRCQSKCRTRSRNPTPMHWNCLPAITPNPNWPAALPALWRIRGSY
ncbi:serine hydrolase domain-containing protein [Rhizobium rhododendri]|uniref:Serine hydrolase n=1 Tax=Rhizobium rhododendri TaxID=2506430 RepID=A0ABY8IP90_9HYPH|nr:serine hydrolase domain-containing protein [Rhizobium rhododendri]WFS24963.1 serine hydrolase [Rhizobium rhododendri]